MFFNALYAVTSSGNPFRVPDEFEVYFQAEHFVDAGDISVPQALMVRQPTVVDGRVVGTEPIFFGEYGRDGRPYAPYGPAVALLDVPFHLLGRAVAAIAGVPRAPLPAGIPWEFLVGGITTLASATGAALAVAGFYRAVIALGAGPRRALVLSLLLGGATMLWPYGTTLYSEAWLAASFIWAAALLIEARSGSSDARPRIVAAAGLLALAGLIKPTALVIAPGFVVSVFFDRGLPAATRRRIVAALAAGILMGAAGQVIWNVERFGRPLDFGYNLAGMVPSLPARSFTLGEIPRGLAVQLLTPGKSLLLWAPPILLALARLGAFRRNEPGIVAGLAFSAASALIFYAAFLFPEGGYAHGPRHLLPLVPLLLLPAAMVRNRRAILACGALGLVVALLAVSISFLEDQGPPPGTDPMASNHYYEHIDPPPGRPWARYRLRYVPFVSTLSSGRWLTPGAIGNGPDFFPYHLSRARHGLPGGLAIPAWLPVAIPLPWIALLGFTAVALVREWRNDGRLGVDGSPRA